MLHQAYLAYYFKVTVEPERVPYDSPAGVLQLSASHGGWQLGKNKDFLW
jgi:hypothetical protein